MITHQTAGRRRLLTLFLSVVATTLVVGGASFGLCQYAPPKSPKKESTDHGIKITFFGTSTLLIDDGKTQVLIDGFFSRPVVGPLLLTKVSTNKKVVDRILKRYEMDRVEAIFVSHSHYDHALDAAYVAQETKAKLYGSESTLKIGRGGGLTEKQLSLFKLKTAVRFGGFSLTVLESKHGRVPFFRNLGGDIMEPLKQPVKARKYVEGGSFDFLVTYKGRTIYIKPSTEYIENGLADVPKADVLFLGAGSLGRRSRAWKAKYYDETIGKLSPRLVIPIHWDNFLKPFSEKLTVAPFAGNNYIANRIRSKKKGVQFEVLDGGQSIVLFADSDLEKL